MSFCKAFLLRWGEYDMSVAIIALLTAFMIDIVWGDPPNRFHPVVAMGNLIHFSARKWNKGSNSRRFWSGTGLIVLGGLLFSLPWLIVMRGMGFLPFWLNGIVTGFLLKPVFAYRGLLNAGEDVRSALVKDDLTEARRLVSWHLVSRDTANLTTSQVASATIESLAENLTDSFLAPLVFFALGGLPLAWAYRYFNTADAMIGYHTTEYEYFGKCAARLDDVINWIPARLAGFLLVLSAGIGRLDIRRAYKVMIRQHVRTSSPNAGWTMSAVAGALGIVLEKTGNYCLQGGDRAPDSHDIREASRLVRISLILGLCLCGGLIVARYQFI